MGYRTAWFTIKLMSEHVPECKRGMCQEVIGRANTSYSDDLRELLLDPDWMEAYMIVRLLGEDE